MHTFLHLSLPVSFPHSWQTFHGNSVSDLSFWVVWGVVSVMTLIEKARVGVKREEHITSSLSSRQWPRDLPMTECLRSWACGCVDKFVILVRPKCFLTLVRNVHANSWLLSKLLVCLWIGCKFLEFPKGSFRSSAIEEQFLVPKVPCEQFLKEPIWFLKWRTL